jgi:acetate---CoA ligase (ADP-forming)
VAPLDVILKPRSIAVIGASRKPETIGNQIFRNLIQHGFTGTAYPVNPVATSVQSVRAYPSVAELPEPVDLAVVAVPCRHVLEVAKQCGERGIGGLVVISAGFKEVGNNALERELLDITRKFGMRMVGPNCMGVLNTAAEVSMNATFAPIMPPTGSVGFVSQSGAMGLSVLDYAKEYGIGIAQFVSVGNKPDVSGNDLLMHWADDASVEVILMYVENFGNPVRFLEIASAITRKKPIIILKSGHSVSGARAAVSHTGALAASDELVDALIEQAGALRARSMEALFDMAIAFTARTRPRSARTAVLTNSGGPGILAADALEANGLQLPELAPETIAKLKTLLPPEASFRNPLDMIASARPADYRSALQTLLSDPSVDSALAIFVPPMGVRQQDVAEAVAAAATQDRAKPVYAVLMARNGLPEGRAELHSAGIPAYVFPESAARGLAATVKHELMRQRCIEPAPAVTVDANTAKLILARVRKEGRERLSQMESVELVRAYGIDSICSRVARNRDDAITAAGELKLPLAMKVVAAAIEHKTDVGGVRLNIRNAEEAGAAFDEMIAQVSSARPGVTIDGVLLQTMVDPGVELIIGAVRDPLFGAAIMVGAGGTLVELLKDVVFRFAPLSLTDAAGMLNQLRSRALLDGYRGRAPVARTAITNALLRVSRLMQDFPHIVELDINPLVAGATGALAVDCRIRLSAIADPSLKEPLPCHKP